MRTQMAAVWYVYTFSSSKDFELSVQTFWHLNSRDFWLTYMGRIRSQSGVSVNNLQHWAHINSLTPGYFNNHALTHNACGTVTSWSLSMFIKYSQINSTSLFDVPMFSPLHRYSTSFHCASIPFQVQKTKPTLF